MAKKPRTFYQQLIDRHDAFRPVEEVQAEILRKQLLSVKRKAQRTIRENMREYTKAGKYIDSPGAIAKAKGTVRDVNDLLKRGFGQVNTSLLSMKEASFDLAVGDFELAAKSLPGDIRTQISGSFSQIFPEAAYAAAEHPVMGVGPGTALANTVNDAQQQVRNILTNSVVNGESVRDTATKIGEALDIDRAAAERVARTNLNAAYNDAQKAIIQANSDIFAGYRWEAVLDDRTSEICMMLHGRTWGLEDIPPGPPAHWNCRSILVPVFRDPEIQELMDEDITRVRNYKVRGDHTVESDGFIRGGTTADEWARKQPSLTTRALTGSKTKSELFRKGIIGFDDIIGPDFKRRTDRQIIRRAAALNPRNAEVQALASAKGIRVPSEGRILAEDRAIAKDLWYDPPTEGQEALETFAEAPPPKLTDPKKIARAERQLEEVKAEIEEVEGKIATASEASKSELKKQRAKLMKKKRGIMRKLPGGGPRPPKPPTPPKPPAPKPKLVNRDAQVYNGLVDQIDDIDNNIRSTLAGLEKTPDDAGLLAQLGEFKKSRSRLAKRARSFKRKVPDALKADLKPIKPVPKTKGRKPVAKKKPGPKAPKPANVPDDIAIPDDLKALSKEVEDLEKAAAEAKKKRKSATREYNRVRREKQRAIRNRDFDKSKELSGELARIADRELKLGNQVSTLQQKLRKTRESFSEKSLTYRQQQLGRMKKVTKRERNLEQALERAKAELDSLMFGESQAKVLNPDDVLKALAQLNGQGEGIALTETRRKIYRNFADQLASGGVSPDQAKQYRQWMDQILRACDESILEDSQLNRITYLFERRVRAAAWKSINQVKYQLKESKNTIWHEFGHHLEYRNRHQRRRSLSWSSARTVGERPVPRRRYRREKVKRDKFYDEYVGRVYSDGIHEVTSMGVGPLADSTDFTNMLTKDYEHFRMMWAFLRGY